MVSIHKVVKMKNGHFIFYGTASPKKSPIFITIIFPSIVICVLIT